ncbi:MAG: NAD(P)/FAD-dependent oxidoreductase [Cyclobacteriaceae bacterium]
MVERCDVGVIGSGMGALTTAALLAKRGLKVKVLEQNYLPGGCTSSYWRKGFIFEAGATTLVGLDDQMPLKYVLDQTGIQVPVRKLDLPMQVHLSNGVTINRHQDLGKWIDEAEQHFGKKGQRPFWEFCYKISQFVWDTSIKQLHFPPTRLNDLWESAKNANVKQAWYARYALMSMTDLLKKYGLIDNQLFIDFVNEQLLITAQNHHEEVNVLFGATALCYTNYGNYYVDGGLLNLVNPFVKYVADREGEVSLREPVISVEKDADSYHITTKKREIRCDYLISGIPLNNTLAIYDNGYADKVKKKLLHSDRLNSAFQMGIGFKSDRTFDSIHHQIHLDTPLPETGSHSIFVSLSHPEDASRSDEPGMRVASVSTHVPDPERTIVDNVRAEEAVIQKLEELDFLKRGDIVYKHSSTPKSWQKWTGRAYGFVGGYPQFMDIKPWQMQDARLDGHKAYICGDTAYPGQGIPGTTLSGIIAYEKLVSDWL